MSTINVNMTEFSKYASISGGIYNVSIVAKAANYADSDPCVLYGYKKPYGITLTGLTGITGSSTNATKIFPNGSVTLTFTANEGYTMPTSISVSNATSTWTSSSGTLNISNPTGEVMVSGSGMEILATPTGITQLSKQEKIKFNSVTNAETYTIYIRDTANHSAIINYDPTPDTQWSASVTTNSNGTATLSKSSGTTANEEITASITANSNYWISDIKWNGSTINYTGTTTATVTLTTTLGENVLTVSYLPSYTITAPQTIGGTINLSKVSGFAGEKVNATISLNSGYEIDSIEWNGNTITNATVLLLTTQQGNNTLTVTYKEAATSTWMLTKELIDQGSGMTGILSVSKTSGTVGETVTVTLNTDAVIRSSKFNGVGFTFTGTNKPYTATLTPIAGENTIVVTVDSDAVSF